MVNYMPGKKTKIGTQGTKIMAEAKRIRKSHPNMKWQTCVKEAAKKLYH